MSFSKVAAIHIEVLLWWFGRDFCDFHKSVPCFLPFFAV